jgi:hypothetical protein
MKRRANLSKLELCKKVIENYPHILLNENLKYSAEKFFF